jgi:Tol biopolymer transport system component
MEDSSNQTDLQNKDIYVSANLLSRKRLYFVVCIILLIIVLISAGFIWWFFKNKETQKNLKVEENSSFINLGDKSERITSSVKLADIGGYDDVLAITYSLNGQKVAFMAKNNNMFTSVVNGIEGKKYVAVSYPNIFSPDSKRLAYVAHDSAKSSRKAWAVIDGVESERYDEVSKLVFSSDSSRVAYWAEQNGKSFVIVDNKQLGIAHDFKISDEALLFSPDSKQVIYITRSGEQKAIFVNDKEKASWKNIDSVSFTPRGELMYTAFDGDKRDWVLVVNDKVNERAYEMVFSPDGLKYAFLKDAFDEESYKTKYYLEFQDGTKSKSYDYITNISLANTGAYIFEAAEPKVSNSIASNYFIVLNGKEEPRYDSVGYPVISADGQRFAYVFQKEGVGHINLDGQSINNTKLPIKALVFSQDGKYFAYTYITEEKQRAITIHDGWTKQYADVFGEPRFSPDGKYVMFGVQINDTLLGSGLWWVVEPVQ